MVRILFIQKIWFELLGIMSISAVLKKNGYSCDLLISSDKQKIINYVKTFRPHVIGFHCVTGQHKWVLELSQAIKKCVGYKVIIILGGPHPTFFPEIVQNEYIDIVCRGEGEYAILDLLNSIEQGKNYIHIKNLYVKLNGRIYKNEVRTLINNLDELPLPDRDIYYEKYHFIRNSPIRYFIASRGCPYHCSFCFNYKERNLYRKLGRYVRWRSADNVIKELKAVHDKYGLKTVRFEDDILSLNRKWLLSLLARYQDEIKVPFSCYLRADSIDLDIALALKNSGCYLVSYAIETGNEKLRNELLCKEISDSQIIKSAEILHKVGLKFVTQNMLGLPGETLENVFETLELNWKIRPDHSWSSVFQPYPSTTIAEYALRHNLMDKINVDDFEPNFFNKSLLRQKDIRKIVNLHKFFDFLVSYPIFFPLVKRMIYLPLNGLFYYFFRVFKLFRYKRAIRTDLITALRIGLKAEKTLK